MKIKSFISSFKTIRFCSSHTVFALSSGHGKCGVAVIRVSGVGTETALKSLTGLSHLPPPRTAILRSIKNPITKEILDKGLILWFPGPHSFTGEDCCEFHVHGGVAVVNSVLNALSTLPKLRLAQAGEFTRRAFYNGKLDLTEVEGLADLLQAETELQRKQAFLQTQGALSKLYNHWRQILIKSVAHIEAHIDFDETEDVEEGVLEEVFQKIDTLVQEIQQHLNDGRKGEMLRMGVKTVILGEPNVGKSSLLNILCQRPAAIVTPLEGTTRDLLEVTLNIGGYPLVLIDTAGLRSNTKDIIELEGINRALNTYKNADLIIIMADLVKFFTWQENNPNLKTLDYLKIYTQQLGLKDLIPDTKQLPENILIVFNKLDLIQNKILLNSEKIRGITYFSCKLEQNVQLLVDNIMEKMKILCGEPSEEHPSMNQMRHRQHLTNCLTNLNTFLSQKDQNDTVLMAEYLRKSLRHLGHLVGATTTEQLLDVIFKDFCIGK